MDDTFDDLPTAPTDPLATSVFLRPNGPLPRVSDRLAEPLVDAAVAAMCDTNSSGAPRADGWTPERIRTFLVALAECGVVEDAARAAGTSRQSAYRLRNSAKGRAFLLAWKAALVCAQRRLADDLMSRAVNGCVDLLYRDGELVAERHRFDNRFTLQVFERIGRQLAQDGVGGAVGLVAEEFEPFVEIASRGGEGAGEFLRRRSGLGERNSDEAERLARAGNYERYGVGLPEEIDTSDLDPEQRENWTEEQLERDARARAPEPPAGDRGEGPLMPLWNFQNCIPGATEPVWLPAGTTPAQARAYAHAGARAGALGCNFRHFRELPGGAEPSNGGATEADPAGAAEASPGSLIGEDAAPLPGPSSSVVVRATCAPEDYDPACGLAPPLGWVATGR